MAFNPRKSIAIGVSVLASIALLVLGFGLVQNVFTRAADVSPQDVVVSEVTQNSAKVEWFTGADVQSVIEYGTAPAELNFFAPETEKTKDHVVDLTLLTPNTPYYFQIRVGDSRFDNGGIPWTFTTKAEGASTLSPEDASALVTPIPATESATCPGTDCEGMKEKFGKGCTTQDYFRCMRSKLSPTPTTAP